MSGKYSLYKYTRKNSQYMGYYSPIDIPFDPNTDYLIQVDKKYENKPGKLALDLFGSKDLMWVFTYFNRDIIQDPIFDLKADIYIRVPTNNRLQQYL